MIAATITVSGRVQGVGFRWWATNLARELRLTGHASNLPDGRVEIRVQGDAEAIGRMIRVSIEEPTTTGRPGRVEDFDLHWVDPEPGRLGFSAR